MPISTDLDSAALAPACRAPATQPDTRRPVDRDVGTVYAVEGQVAAVLDRARSGSGSVDFFGSQLTVPVERRFADTRSLQRWVDGVLALSAVRERCAEAPACEVVARRGQRAAHYVPPGVIAVPMRERWALRELVLCHELAHHLVWHKHVAAGRRAALQPSHGEQFRAAHAWLVDEVIGAEVGLLLRAGWSEAGLR